MHSTQSFITFVSSLIWTTAIAAVPAQDLDRTPDWAQDVIWYQIFPERFANADSSNDPTRKSLDDPSRVSKSWKVMQWTDDWYSRTNWEKEMGPHFYDTVYHRRYGGDLQGVIDRLDYLKGFGVTGIYFNPIFYANSLHKYDGNSFHHIDPYFGPDPDGDLELIAQETSNPSTWQWTAADQLFLELLREAKTRNIRVIIDGVWNHTGRNFFAFRDIAKNSQKSRYARWYDIIAFDDPRTARNEFDYHGWYGYKSLPEFANDPSGQNLAPGPKRYVFSATERWMDPNGDGDPSDGIDGWRLDVAEELPAGFWREWNAHVRTINPEAFTTAEIWGSSAKFLEETHFSSAMNYRGFAIPIKGWLVDGKISASEFARRLDHERNSRSPEAARILQNLVDSHDTQRIASMIANRSSFQGYKSEDWFDYDDSERVSARTKGYNLAAPDKDGRRIWKMLALFQATYVGAPMIYYGTEAGMWGADDPDDRMPMWWAEMDFSPQNLRPNGQPRSTPQPAGFDQEIFDSYQAAFQLRNEHPALRQGDFQVLEARDNAQVLAFERKLGNERLVVIFNRGNDDARVDSKSVNGLSLLYSTDPAANAFRIPRLSAALFGVKSVSESIEPQL
ncbi:glycoside hydrolase family 13 protein [Cerasicoccus arenae]|uniref:Alpha-amylase n=1 Tax=Cerasicoccus arenae TaxID=424488 RepID=A0A8J3GCN6_9BACT|nr:glycoside hydrolase family 13 protein [Cerasicoccus arenae]MBK1857209.1 alpha-glucosidase C-terminal domain-containing protein [Cerasicoccus arenae]GHC00009.1 alpha-amylase [Cerasicoccus arenae]